MSMLKKVSGIMARFWCVSSLGPVIALLPSDLPGLRLLHSHRLMMQSVKSC